MKNIDEIIEAVKVHTPTQIKIDDLIKEVQQKYAEAAKMCYNILKQAGDPTGIIKHHIKQCKQYNKDNHEKLKEYHAAYQKEYAPKYREQHPEQMC